jgi:hypothetical protein
MLYQWAAPFFLLALASVVAVVRLRGPGRVASVLFFAFAVLTLGTLLLAAFMGRL